ncbi:hypothetical protein MNBD_GAMMA01-1274 [hydrothermal vent metagenome]|uniref:Outer-membrane lipoprotein LolB n=1 Tax=hydrothermal vent metagenome TaxID=652676 RepID=A0A3B0V767_9ZZZZ
MQAVILIVLISLLFSCQKNRQLKPDTKFSQWSQVKSWSLTGKMAINDGQNSGSGRIKWLVSGNEINARFKAPLGQGSWSVYATDDTAKLTSSINGEMFATDAQMLIAQELGWHFPWNNLQYWLRGYSSDAVLQKHDVTFTTLHEDGWDISYKQWMPTAIGLLPKKITAQKSPYTVKLIIYAWDIN